MSLLPPGSTTLILIYTDLYSTNSPPVFPVLDRLSVLKWVHSRRPPTDVPAIAVLLYSVWSTGPSRPCSPLRVPLLLLLPPFVFYPFPALNIANFHVNPFGCSSIGSVQPMTFPWTTPLPCLPWPCWEVENVTENSITKNRKGSYVGVCKASKMKDVK